MPERVRTFVRTGRTAMSPWGVEPIYETWVEHGPFAGALYEVTPSEMNPSERLAVTIMESATIVH